MELVEKVRRILTLEFPPPAIITLDGEGGIVGSVVSSRFEGMETIDRIRLIRETLKNNLAPEERGRVLAIAAATPEDEIALTS